MTERLEAIAVKIIASVFPCRPKMWYLMVVACLVFVDSVQADISVWNRWEHTLIGRNTYTNHFLWLGDTAWSAINTMTDDDWRLYVNHRVRQKFNVAQMICGTGWAVKTTDRSGNAPFRGEGRQEIGWAKSTSVSDADFRWNPAFWQGVDRKVHYANDCGMIAFFCAIGQNHNGK